MKKIISIILSITILAVVLASCSSTTPSSGSSDVAGIKDGTYIEIAKGNNADVKVEVVIENSKISTVTVISHEESDGIADKALSDIPKSIVANQSIAIDAISSATVTSNAIIEAVGKALVTAGATLSDWQTAPEVQAVMKKDDATCDTVIIGAGGAGIKTAVDLVEAGQSVIIVEKMPFVGGATNLAATYLVVVDTQEQKDAGFGLPVSAFVANQLKANPNFNEANLTRMFSASQSILDWLNSLGADFTRPLSNYQIGTSDGSSLGVSMVRAMSAELDRADTDLRLETTATSLIVENGKVMGVTVMDAGGEYNIYADNVVIATGGFASSQEAVKEFAPDWAGLPSTSAAGSTGDGVKMATAVGASLKFMDSVRLNPSVYSNGTVNVSLSAARAEGGIMVNLDGKRFCNDYFPDYTQLSYWMLEQEGDHVYIIVDQKSMDASKRLQGFLDQGYFLQAETLEELAELMGVPSENLTETISTYSEYAKNGVDEEFGRAANMNTTFETAPYYAIKTQPGIQVTLGGIEVNENMQVVTETGENFDNLYAVGEVAHDGLFGGAPTTINVFYGGVVAEHILTK